MWLKGVCLGVKIEDGQKEIFDSVVAPMFAQCVSGVLGTRQEVEINELGCDCFTCVME